MSDLRGAPLPDTHVSHGRGIPRGSVSPPFIDPFSLRSLYLEKRDLHPENTAFKIEVKFASHEMNRFEAGDPVA